MSELSLAERFKIKSPAKIDTKQTVLVAEEQTDVKMIVVHHLRKLGFSKIKPLSSGMDVLEYMKDNKEPVAAIVCAIKMRNAGAIDVLAELQNNPEYRRPPFAIAMEDPSEEKIMLAMESGADEILVKPFTLNDIMPKVNTTFKKYHNPKNPEKVYEMAKNLFRNQRFEDAEKVYRLLAAENQKAARPWVGIAKVKIELKQYPEALEMLDKAEDCNPSFVHVHSTRAETYVLMGKVDDAIKAYEQAIELSPLNPFRYEEAAKHLFKAKRYNEGIALLNKAISNELNFPALHLYLSEGYYATKDYEKAVKYIRTAISNDPENVLFLNQLGVSLKELGQTEEALKTYNQIIKIDNDNKAAYYNKSILLFNLGQKEEAIKLAERILKKFPDFKPMQIKLDEYKKTGNAAA